MSYGRAYSYNKLNRRRSDYVFTGWELDALSFFMADIIFSSCGLILLLMGALCNRAGHYIFALWFLSFFLSSFFPRLISAAADWMSATLRQVVWPKCEFRLQV